MLGHVNSGPKAQEGEVAQAEEAEAGERLISDRAVRLRELDVDSLVVL